MLVQLFGSIAFVTSVVGFFPQIYKALKTRSTVDISMLMLINYTICSLAWVVYGVNTASFYVEASNVLGLIGCAALIVLKMMYDKNAIVLSK